MASQFGDVFADLEWNFTAQMPSRGWKVPVLTQEMSPGLTMDDTLVLQTCVTLSKVQDLLPTPALLSACLIAPQLARQICGRAPSEWASCTHTTTGNEPSFWQLLN